MIDLFILLILILSFLYSWKVSKKINSLKNTKEDFAILMQGFDEAIMRAEISIKDLKKMSQESVRDIDYKIENARKITEELSFITDRAVEIAEKLQDLNDTSIKNAARNMKRSVQKQHYEDDFMEEQKVHQPQINSRTNIDSLLDKINRVQTQNNAIGYKKSIVGQQEFYKSLKKVSL